MDGSIDDLLRDRGILPESRYFEPFKARLSASPSEKARFTEETRGYSRLRPATVLHYLGFTLDWDAYDSTLLQTMEHHGTSIVKTISNPYNEGPFLLSRKGANLAAVRMIGESFDSRVEGISDYELRYLLGSFGISAQNEAGTFIRNSLGQPIKSDRFGQTQDLESLEAGLPGYQPVDMWDTRQKIGFQHGLYGFLRFLDEAADELFSHLNRVAIGDGSMYLIRGHRQNDALAAMRAIYDGFSPEPAVETDVISGYERYADGAVMDHFQFRGSEEAFYDAVTEHRYCLSPRLIRPDLSQPVVYIQHSRPDLLREQVQGILGIR